MKYELSEQTISLTLRFLQTCRYEQVASIIRSIENDIQQNVKVEEDKKSKK